MLLILNDRIAIIGGRDDVEDSLKSEHSPQEGTRWGWRLDSRSRREEQVPGSEGGITVLREIWGESAHGDHLEVVGNMPFCAFSSLM